MSVEDRLQSLNIELPDPAAPAANYVPFVVTGSLVSVSGQLPMQAGELAFRGKVGLDVTEDEAKQAARLCGINILAQLKAAAGGDLQRISRVVKLGGFVNCVDGFESQPAIINGASDLMVEVFGDHGRHARFAVGTNSLPFNASVEIDALAELG